MNVPTARTAVITGAASGIGQACARTLVSKGWRVFSLDRSFAEASVAGELITQIRCDVSDSASVRAAFERIAGAATDIDALICSAGILRTGSLEDTSEADFDAVFAVNVRGAWLCAKAALPLLGTAQGRDFAPRMIFLSSIAAIRPKIGGGLYAASKAALSTLARVLAVEVAERGVLVNAIAPGTVDTPFIAAASAAKDSSYRVSGQSPLGRTATTADVVGVVEFLLGPAADYVTGTIIPLDGGTTAAFVPPRG